MNQAMPRLMSDPRITMHLLPIPSHATKATSASSAALPPKKENPVNAKGRGKVRREGKQSQKARAMCPAEMKDYKQQDDQGRPICWAYNLKAGCKEQVADGRCKKGAHICIKCKRANHGLATCRVNS
jgi:hypothetical protein